MLPDPRPLFWRLYRHNVIRYLCVGGTTVIIDVSLLRILHGTLHVHLALATAIAYWTALVYNFTLNRFWTFSAAETSNLLHHLMPYGALLGFNFLFTEAFVNIFGHHIMSPYLAKIISIPIQMTWTYPVYKKIFTPNVRNSIDVI